MVKQIKKSENTSGNAASNQKMFNNKKTKAMKKFNLKKTVALAAIAMVGFTGNVNGQAWVGGGGVLYSNPPATTNVGIGTSAPTAKLTVVDNTNTNAYAGLFGLTSSAASGQYCGIKTSATLGNGATDAFGISAEANAGATNNYGVYGQTGGTPGSGINAGVYGFLGSNSAGTTNAAIYGDANGFTNATDWACYFVGRTYSSVTGWTASDLRFKKGVTEIKNVKDKLLNLKPYSYQFKRDEFPKMSFDEKTHFGFIAQELKEFFPELVTDDGKGYYAVNYSEMIPLLLSAFKEQEQEIKELKSQMSISQQKHNTTTGVEELTSDAGFSMAQNKPNPFDKSTIINYTLPSSVNSAAYLMICDYSGKKLLTYNLVNKTGDVSVEAKDLPSEGIYLYSIVSNGEVLGIKKMVISNPSCYLMAVVFIRSKPKIKSVSFTSNPRSVIA